MKTFFLFSLICFFAINHIVAQPPARLRQQQEQQKNTISNNLSTSVREFPVQPTMPKGVTWKRDIYRAIDLKLDENAPLYYPIEPQGAQINLFTYVFKLLLRGQLKAYTYRLDGNEDFSANNVLKIKEFLDSHHIYYESKDGKIKLNEADLPCASVLQYFIKEADYYDPQTASFHTQVEAFCPVLIQDDGFGGEPVKYPLFWIKYADIAEPLTRLPLMVSNLNNAATMSANDYFSLKRYKGEIYKTNNMQGKVLATGNDSIAKAERQKIETELKEVQKFVWGNDTTQKQATKTTAEVATKVKPVKTKMATRRNSVEKAKPTTPKVTTPSNNTPRVTARRQRR